MALHLGKTNIGRIRLCRNSRVDQLLVWSRQWNRFVNQSGPLVSRSTILLGYLSLHLDLQALHLFQVFQPLLNFNLLKISSLDCQWDKLKALAYSKLIRLARVKRYQRKGHLKILAPKPNHYPEYCLSYPSSSRAFHRISSNPIYRYY